MKKLLTGLLLTAAASPYLAAQTANQNGQLIASVFGNWSVPKGDISNFQWSNGAACTINTGGVTFQAFKAGTPIKIVETGNAANTETVTPFAVTITTSGCTVRVNPTKPHYSFYLQSATAGLQEALNYAGNQAYTIALTPDWTRIGGTTAMLSTVTGGANVSIADQRTAILQPYTVVPATGAFVASAIGVGSVTINGKTGSTITLVPADIGADAAGAAAAAQTAAIAASDPAGAAQAAKAAAIAASDPTGAASTAKAQAIAASDPLGAASQAQAAAIAASDPAGAATNAKNAAIAASDPVGAAATALASAKTYSANASNITTGSLPANVLPPIPYSQISNPPVLGAAASHGASITISGTSCTLDGTCTVSSGAALPSGTGIVKTTGGSGGVATPGVDVTVPNSDGSITTVPTDKTLNNYFTVLPGSGGDKYSSQMLNPGTNGITYTTEGGQPAVADGGTLYYLPETTQAVIGTSGTGTKLMTSAGSYKAGNLLTTNAAGDAIDSGYSGGASQGTQDSLSTIQGYNSLNPAVLSALNLNSIAENNIQTNKTTFTDGSVYYRAAPQYTYSFISDTSLAMLGEPSFFLASDVQATIVKYMAAISNTTNEPTIPAGSIPIFLNQDGTPATDATDYPSYPATRAYCAGFDTYCHHPTSEGVFSLVHLENLLYVKTKSTTQFSADAATIDAAMTAIPINTTTGLPTITAGDEWTCFGFQESIRFTGAVATCAVQMWKTQTEIAALYTALGNTSQASKYTAAASKLASSLGTSSALWDSADGMFWGATGQDKAIDTTASALFCQYQIPTANLAAQCNAISTYMVANYATLTYQGFVRQSNVNFPVIGQITSSGKAPYNTTDPRNGAGCYQGGGYWSHFNRAVVETLNITSPAMAGQLMQDFQQNADQTMEYYAPSCPTAGYTHGFTNNLESPVGIAYAAREFPALGQVPNLGLGGGVPTRSGLKDNAYALTDSSTNEVLSLQNYNAAGYSSINFFNSQTIGQAIVGYGNAEVSQAFLQNQAFLGGINTPVCLFTVLGVCQVTLDVTGDTGVSQGIYVKGGLAALHPGTIAMASPGGNGQLAAVGTSPSQTPTIAIQSLSSTASVNYTHMICGGPYLINCVFPGTATALQVISTTDPIPSGAAPVFDVGKGGTKTFTLNANANMALSGNIASGTTFDLQICQPATGTTTYTISFVSIFHIPASVVTSINGMAVNTCAVLGFHAFSTSSLQLTYDREGLQP